jgi:hypothetical protein
MSVCVSMVSLATSLLFFSSRFSKVFLTVSLVFLAVSLKCLWPSLSVSPSMSQYVPIVSLAVSL